MEKREDTGRGAALVHSFALGGQSSLSSALVFETRSLTDTAVCRLGNSGRHTRSRDPLVFALLLPPVGIADACCHGLTRDLGTELGPSCQKDVDLGELDKDVSVKEREQGLGAHAEDMPSSPGHVVEVKRK